MNAKLFARVIGSGVALVVASIVSAFVHIKDEGGYVNAWFPGSIPMQVKLATSPALSDGTSQSSSVVAAMAAWNAQLGIVQFTAQQVGPGIYAAGNEVNEIAMDSNIKYAEGDPQDFGANTLAVTISWTAGNERVESDIIFNTAWTWDSYRGNLQEPEDIRRVAIHELGHVLGLTHPDQHGQSVVAIMNSTASNVDALQSDDIAGAQVLYGAPGFVPANNQFANATAISLSTGSTQVTGTNVAATEEAGEPGNAGEIARRTVWWKWTAPSGGSATVTTLGSNFDTVLGVHTGSVVSGLTPVGSNDDVQSGVIRTSSVTFNATGGTTYNFAVDGWDGYFGAITLNLTFTPTGGPVAPPSIFVQPADRTVNEGPITFGGPLATASFSVLPHVEPGIPIPTIQWQRLPAGSANWENLVEGSTYSSVTGFTLTITPATRAMNGDRFRAVLTNSGGTTTSNAATLTVPAPTAPTFVALQYYELTALAGTSLTLLHGGYNGNGIITLQWYRNDVAIPGATGPSLALANLQLADAGNYALRVTNASGSAISPPCVLTVLPGVSVARAVASMSGFSAFINSLGELWMMGSNSFGALGDSSTAERRSPIKVASGVVDVALGANHSLYIKSDGTLWGMGSNGNGQLGLGSPDTFTTPTQITTNVITVAAGHHHTVFVKGDGTLWGMGNNIRGQLGNGTQTDQRTPILIATNVVKAAAGGGHTLFIKGDGSLWGIGANGHYQLGTTSIGQALVPVQITTGVASAAAGIFHSVFLRTDGTLWGMGAASGGELGDGALFWAVPITANAIATGVAEIAASNSSSFFRKTDGTLWGMAPMTAMSWATARPTRAIPRSR